MTRDSVRAAQATARTLPPVQAVFVTITAVNTTTVTITLPGGGTMTAPRAKTIAYAVGDVGWALIQEPGVIAVIPTAS